MDSNRGAQKMYLAYKYVTIAIVIVRANYCADRLGLPVDHPIKENGLTFKFAVSPRAMPYVDHGGAIDVTNFSFSFGDRHCFIVKLHSFGGLSAAEQNETLSHAKSLVTTNQSYELATNWLRLLDVDIAKLEAAIKPE